MGGARCVATPFPGVEPVARPAVVEGTVRDETGIPLVGARTLLGKSDEPMAHMVTRQDGRYALAVFETGTYALAAQTAGSRLQWAYVWTEEAEQEEDLQGKSVFLREDESLHLDLTAPSSLVAHWPGEGNGRDFDSFFCILTPFGLHRLKPVVALDLTHDQSGHELGKGFR